MVIATPYQYLFNSDQGITEGILEADLKSRGHKIGHYLELVNYEYQDRRDPAWPLVAYMRITFLVPFKLGRQNAFWALMELEARCAESLALRRNRREEKMSGLLPISS
jgi:hypothetical protein